MKKKKHTSLPSSPTSRELAPTHESNACAYPTLNELRTSSSRAFVERVAQSWWAPMAVAGALTVSSFAIAPSADAQERDDSTTVENRQAREEAQRERRRRERERARQDHPRPHRDPPHTGGVPPRARHDDDANPFQ